MSFNFDFQVYTIILLAVAALSAAIVCFYYCPFVRRVSRRRRECCLTVDTPEGKRPEWVPASIIIYAQGEADRLENLLPVILGQDYGGTFEVIVINEGDSADVRSVINALQLAHRNLYRTFTPDGARNLSRKKLALTLGIKAAKGDVILTTVANAVIPSDRWISTLAAPFISDPQIELSLGYSRHDYTELGSSSRRYKEFFAFLTDARWIGYALMKKAYRGDGFNLAFRRETFFSRKGYSKTINLHTGEDDLFVHDIATPYNTAVAISPEAIITTRWQDSSKRIFNLRRSQYDFTARWLPLGPFVRAGLASTAQWMILLTGIAAALIALPNLLPAAIAFIVWLIFIIADHRYSQTPHTFWKLRCPPEMFRYSGSLSRSTICGFVPLTEAPDSKTSHGRGTNSPEIITSSLP
ncbi:MAG: glycosyltransferase [Muribaculaceae bacterium]|nr:glycosyltransferase [Muribaculaceae bacterium]